MVLDDGPDPLAWSWSTGTARARTAPGAGSGASARSAFRVPRDVRNDVSLTQS